VRKATVSLEQLESIASLQQVRFIQPKQQFTPIRLSAALICRAYQQHRTHFKATANGSSEFVALWLPKVLARKRMCCRTI
jgi:hypothetical protein